jgi:hypothetical protein
MQEAAVRSVVVVDGQAGPEYGGVAEGSLMFSPDGKRVVYVAGKGEKWVVVVDGQPGPEYDVVVKGGPIFRADGMLEFLAVKNNELCRVKYPPRL